MVSLLPGESVVLHIATADAAALAAPGVKQYYPDRTENFVFRPEVVARTEIFCLKVEHMTGKKRFKKS